MSNRKLKHLKTKETLEKVLSESIVILAILGSAWVIHSAAKWLFIDAKGCEENIEIVITIHGVSGVPRPGSEKVDIKTVEKRCKESK